MTEYLRVFKPYNIEEVHRQLLILGDLTADCASCRELGLEPYSTRNCPKCGAEFKYATSRRMETSPGERFQIVKRLQDHRPDLIIVDYGDYSKTLAKKKARDFFA